MVSSSRTANTVLHQGRFLRLIQKGSWEYVERENCRGIVIILAVTSLGKILFVEQFRPPVNRRVIELPAGLVNDHERHHDESVSKAAQRELLEETGYQAKKIVKLIRGPVSGGLTSDMVTLVRAFDLTKVGPGGGDGTEGITVHEVSPSKVKGWLQKMSRQGCLIEPKIYSALYFLNKN